MGLWFLTQLLYSQLFSPSMLMWFLNSSDCLSPNSWLYYPWSAIFSFSIITTPYKFSLVKAGTDLWSPNGQAKWRLPLKCPSPLGQNRVLCIGEMSFWLIPRMPCRMPYLPLPLPNLRVVDLLMFYERRQYILISIIKLNLVSQSPRGLSRLSYVET